MASGPNPNSAIPSPDALAGLYCPECGYDLRGLTSDRCPECGFELSLIQDPESRIPWTRRRKLGFFRAYWGTVWQVMFRHKELCREIYRPQNYAAARGFQFVTVLHVFAAFLIGLAYMIVFQSWSEFKRIFDDFGYVIPSVALSCIFLYFFALTGLPSYFFHPRFVSVEQQNRAIVLSYYAAAPLAWLPLPVAVLIPLAVKTAELHQRSLEMLWLGIMLLAILSPVAVVLMYWLTLIRTAGQLFRDTNRTTLVALAVPALWLALGVLLLFAVPAIILYGLVLFHGFIG